MLANFAAVSTRLPSETCQLKSGPRYPFFYTTAAFSCSSPPPHPPHIHTPQNNPTWHATKFQFVFKAFFTVIMQLRVKKQLAILMALFALAIILLNPL